MPVITRSIPAVPYQGGTPQTAQPYSAAVQLTSTRMVWTYCQTNPAWRFFVIVDTPEGFVNGGTPTVTVARMQDQRQYQGTALYMTRLNDNAFAIFDANGVNTNNWSVEAFEITGDLEFKKTYANYSQTLTAWHSNSLSTQASLKYTNHLAFLPVKDNVFYLVENNTNNNQINGRTIVYDNTKDVNSSLAIPANNTVTTLGSHYTSYPCAELVVRPIPGAASTKYSVAWHGTSTIGTATTQGWVNPSTATLSVTTTGNSLNSVGAVIIDVAPTVANSASAPTVSNSAATTNTGVANQNTLWVYSSTSQLPLTGMATPYDIVHMSETRLAKLNWQNAYFYGTSTANYLVGQGGGSFAYGAPAVAPMMAYGLSNDFIMLIDRTHFISPTSGDIKIKIIRRDDSNFVSVSGGSTAGTGFSVTAPWIDTWRQDSRPKMLANGDLFWWGLDATTGNANLTWNILKNAS